MILNHGKIIKIVISLQCIALKYALLSAKFNLLHCSKSISVIKVPTMKNMLHKRSHHVLPTNWQFPVSVKMNRTQKRKLISP